MVSWRTVEVAEPEFAHTVRSSLEAGRHKTIATIRADGSPRISGIECEFTEDGALRFGSMIGSRKGADLRRDARFALHGPTVHPEVGAEAEWPGEAKVAGRAIPSERILDDEGNIHGEWFVCDVEEVVWTGLNDDATLLVVEFWTPARGLQRRERS